MAEALTPQERRMEVMDASVERLVDVYVEVLFERDKLIRMRANLAADEYDKHVTPKILELEAHIASRKDALIAHVEGLEAWEAAVVEAAMLTEAVSPNAEPRKVINDVIWWHIQVALDPKIGGGFKPDSASRVAPVNQPGAASNIQKLEQQNAELRAMLTKVLEVTEEVDDISNCVACGNGIGGDGTGHAEDCLIQRAKQHVTKGTQPRAVWVIQDRGESYVDFSLFHEGVVGDPMTYRVPRECLTYLSIIEIPEKAHKEGWAMWLG